VVVKLLDEYSLIFEYYSYIPFIARVKNLINSLKMSLVRISSYKIQMIPYKNSFNGIYVLSSINYNVFYISQNSRILELS